MPPEKRNKFLDADESDDELDQGYDSEAEELRKGGRSAKRRKVDSEDEDDFSDEEQNVTKDAEDAESDDEGADGENDTEASTSTNKKKSSSTSTKLDLPDVSKPLTKKNLVATEEAIKKSGVVYISRIPPFMKPQKLRSLLEPYGKVNRIFLAPEDPTAHTRRVKAGGNKKKLYTEGWVEFMRKKDAKAVCELLNARTIGGKKGSYYHDDIWTLKYLKGFKWRHLTEQITAENMERTSRMRAEISKASKENKEFVRNVEKARVLDGIAATREKRGKAAAATEVGASFAGGAATAAADEKLDKRRTVFKQIPLADRKSEAGSAAKPAGDVARVLGKIF
ncbi:RNA recognition domain-containing protein [Colletotrichum godetiae]|uniref:18S rRNA factor 2 n=1 Tax=Colletotrichum godetiae TaxID=1209918 RepID=A0AAJ0F437_9PEZI|nr:RNA recognition domain-containing protein [Colletotrichum godetiae]KAK1700050.1 RNA recognition domain-containing protein [Colletotrichum godetiae]